MAHRRTRPSFLLPAWRAVGFAVGTSATALLPVESSAKVGAAITRAVTDQYDANIRSMYEARIEEAESEVRYLGGWGRGRGESVLARFVFLAVFGRLPTRGRREGARQQHEWGGRRTVPFVYRPEPLL